VPLPQYKVVYSSYFAPFETKRKLIITFILVHLGKQKEVKDKADTSCERLVFILAGIGRLNNSDLAFFTKVDQFDLFINLAKLQQPLLAIVDLFLHKLISVNLD
jgi:hypothetical protein